MTVVGQCRLWLGTRRRGQHADNIWCPVIYNGYRGWANAYFLAFTDGRRVACVVYPKAQGCISAPLAQAGASTDVPSLESVSSPPQSGPPNAASQERSNIDAVPPQ